MLEKEFLIAQLAIQRASILSQLILKDYAQKYASKTITKEDHSPVTIADFAVQSVIISSITEHFPGDLFIAEESGSDIVDRSDLKALIKEYIGKADAEFNKYQYQYKFKSEFDIVENLNKKVQKQGSSRFWILDPIDGTKGFLRNQQFALCLSLMVNNQIKIGINGCPNLPVNIEELINAHDFAKSNFEIADTQGDKGLVFAAVEGKGSHVRLLDEKIVEPFGRKIGVKHLSSISDTIIVEGVELKHSNYEYQLKIKRKLAIPESHTINIDSQVKYCVLAYGLAQAYLRIPVDKKYKEKVWDHSSGNLLVREAGGIVTDMEGKQLDFTKGTYLYSKGIIAASEQYHSEFIKAIKEIGKF